MLEAFDKVKPLCVNLTKRCTAQDVEKLQLVCQGIDDLSLQMLQEYLIFPLRFNLCKEINISAATKSINLMEFVFSKTTIHSWNVFCDVLMQIFKIIWNTKLSMLRDCSEELKQAVCDCAYVVVSHSTNEILLKMFSEDFYLPLAQYLYILLAILKSERSKVLKLSGLRALSVFCYSDSSGIQLENVKICAGARLAAFLPGVAVRLSEIISGDEKQGHKIIVTALVLLREFLTLTVGDIYVNKNEICSKFCVTSSSSKYLANVPIIERNKLWMEETACKLETVVKRAMTAVSHDHWKVRLNLCHFAESILCNCVNNLSNCISSILQVLFVVSVDRFENIAAAGQHAISKFSENVETVKLCSAILEEEIFTASSKLIRISFATNDTEKLLLLKTIFGYLEILGPSVNQLLYSSSHLERFLYSLLALIKFDCNNIHFIQESFSQKDSLNNECIGELWQSKQFLYFHDKEVHNTICLICNALGCYGDARLLIDFFTNELNKPMYKKESIHLMTRIVAGLNVKNEAESNHFFNQGKFEEYFNIKYRDGVVSCVLEQFLFLLNDGPSVSNSELNVEPLLVKDTDCGKVFESCLILEAFAVFSEVLGPDFLPHLMQVLCPIMKKTGSPISVISQTSRIALNKIAHFCQYESPTKLVVENADYLINSIMTGFCHFPSNPEICFVLQFILEQCEVDVLPLFKDAIFCLFKALDYNQEDALIIMKVFRSVIVAVHKWYPNNSTTDTKRHISKTSKDINMHHEFEQRLSVKAAFQEHCKMKTIESSYCSEDVFEDNHLISSNDTLLTEPASEVNLYVDLVTNILQRTVHLQSTSNLELCILILDIVGRSIVALGSENDKLLPYVHKYWSSFVPQFSGHVVVTMKAFETLLIIASECGDFVKTRTLKDVWLKLLSYLKIKSNLQKRSNLQSNEFKIKHLILSNIGYLAQKLFLEEKEFEMLTLHCLPYLSENQPSSIQTAAQSSIKCLKDIDSDAFWFYFNEFHNYENLKFPVNMNLMTLTFSS